MKRFQRNQALPILQAVLLGVQPCGTGFSTELSSRRSLRKVLVTPQTQVHSPLIRVLAVSNRTEFGSAIRRVLDPQRPIEIVGTIVPEQSAPEKLNGKNLDVLLVDYEVRDDRVLHLTQTLRQHLPQTPALATLRHPDEQALRALIRVQVKGLVLGLGSTATLMDAITAVSSGKRYLDPAFSDVVLDLLERHVLAERTIELTGREKQVLKLIADGNTYKEIAGALNVSVKTVETYRTRLGEKLQLRSRRALARYAHTNGLL